MVGVRETAERLNVSVVRVRQLIHSGALTAEQMSGGTFVIDADALDDFATRRRVAHTRGYSQAVGWAAAALADGVTAASWLSGSEVSRLRTRLDLTVNDAQDERLALWRTRLHRLADRTEHYRVHADNLTQLLADERVVASGAFATNLVGDGLFSGTGTIWLQSHVNLTTVQRDYALLRSDASNLTVRLHDGTYPIGEEGQEAAYRLVVAIDLLDEGGARSERAAANLIDAVLDERRWRSR